MKLKQFFAVLLIFVGFGLSANAQVKIGYTNIELVLLYLPEAKQIDKQLQVYEQKLSEQISLKENLVKQKLEQYLKDKEAVPTTQAQDEAFQKELIKDEEDLRKFAADSEQKLMERREQELGPMLEKLQNSINEVAKENGFTYILNQTTSAGVSTILFGPEENDITELLMKKLGIALPEGGGQ